VTSLEIDSLLNVSARIGADPLLIQAGTGNTSLKRDGTLWIKASGKWLARAGREEILIPVDLAETRGRIARRVDPAGQFASVNGLTLGTSVETAMHAVLPWASVLHVHSINTIAWAVREDGAEALARRLEGVRWQWIPFVPSGLALAESVAAALTRDPRTNVLVLANHGLIVCGDSPEEAETRLREFELRVAIAPRVVPTPGYDVLIRLAAENSHWRCPQSAALQAIGSDPVSRRIAMGGVLYPCQAIFLTPQALTIAGDARPAQLERVPDPFVLVEDAGILVREKLNAAASATLAGLAQVLQRIPEYAALKYLTPAEVGSLLCADVYHYRDVVQNNGR
jgi:rhamnose utilization protein RhaD (predicted bifunctional aldolase and dehydrogenase)